MHLTNWVSFVLFAQLVFLLPLLQKGLYMFIPHILQNVSNLALISSLHLFFTNLQLIKLSPSN